MPVVVVGVAESIEAAPDVVLTTAGVLAVLTPTERQRVALASVVAPIDGRRVKGPGVLRVDGVAVVASTSLVDGLAAVDTLPDPIRVLVVPQAAWRRKPVDEAVKAAADAGRVLTVIPIRSGSWTLLRATNEYGQPVTVEPVASPVLAPEIDEDPTTAPPEPIP